tara:strand:+ start:86 stop:481 length:396 start_codon:yes stop_codon:yes gene_type:complete
MYNIFLTALMIFTSKYNLLLDYNRVKEPARINIYSEFYNEVLNENIDTEHPDKGCDERYKNISTPHDEIVRIREYFEKHKLLKILEDGSINNETKMDYLEKDNALFNASKQFNLYAGGLMHEFDFMDFEGF